MLNTEIISKKVQASEVSYELHSLGWKAFQNLCITITSEIFGQTIQGFCDTNDGGRDGAFYGIWKSTATESFQGTFTVQCKFTAKSDTYFSPSDVTDEITKAKRLVTKGLADNYFLFTNAGITGKHDEEISQKFKTIAGVKHVIIYGRERISQIIKESARLRMLVPRIYGLGDLSQIIDERAYAQAQEILSAMGDDLSKFIITEAYRQSAKALAEHGFILLIGDPACGKSTIAATLAIAALDQWSCLLIKIRNATDFIKHSNPNEKQFFWIDDAFGETQFDHTRTIDWNAAFPHINAAIKRGSKVIFTSRNYIYNAAKSYLKESVLPIMKESQIVIYVEDLTKDEREQILYNHIRLGTQPKKFKSQIKNFLPQIAMHEKFSPEIARRLGDPLFTKSLSITTTNLTHFIENPAGYLYEIINSLDDGSRSALALIFMRGGRVISPIQLNRDEQDTICELLGSTKAQIIKALDALNGSLVLNSLESHEQTWKFKHPTIRDAFATVVAEKRELMDIYLAGAPIDKLFQEISCGDMNIEGVKVIVPKNRYEKIILRLESFKIEKWQDEAALYRFLSYRCDKVFLQLYLKNNPQFISQLNVYSYLAYVSDIDVLVRLQEYGLLPEEKRLNIVKEIRLLAVETPDAGFLDEKIRKIMTPEELADTLDFVREKLLFNLNDCIEEWRSNYNDEEPDIYFDELLNELAIYKRAFQQDENIVKTIDEALDYIDIIIGGLLLDDDDDDDLGENDFFSEHVKRQREQISIRSIFDDVDL